MSPQDRRNSFWDRVVLVLFVATLLANACGLFGA
jgi:hypothetical protein